MNTYTGITDCYDLLMRAGYYDHEGMAKAADAVMGERTSVLELGVGTGLFAQCLNELNPDYQITGVDFTPEMLEIAQERVGPETELLEEDVTSMDLGRTFDTAISSGGVWVVIDDEDDYLLGTHLNDYDSEVQGLANVNEHLERDGLLLLSVQDMHHDFDQELDDGVTYSQRVKPAADAGNGHFVIDKQYRFTRGSELLAAQQLRLGFYRRSLMDQIFEEAGFVHQGLDDESRFFVFGKDQQRAGAPSR